MLRLASVTPREGLTVHVTLTDGSIRDIDLAPYLTGGVFAPIAASRDAFLQVRIDPISGTLCWPGGLDLDPDVLLGLAPSGS